MNKYLAAAAITGTLGLAGLSTAGIVAAQSGTSTKPTDGLVSAIADKFNLNKDEVQQVFDDQRATMQQQRETELKNKLTNLVSDSKLTQDQADKIIAKRTELHAQREADRSSDQTMTRSEMRTQRADHKKELEQWASDNGISKEYLRYVMAGPGGPRSEHSPGNRMADMPA